MSKAENILMADDLMIPQNGETAIKVKYKFDSDNLYTAYSFNIVLPEELEFVSEGDGKVVCSIGSCHDVSHCVVTNISDGKLKVASLSLRGKPLIGTEDILLTFMVRPTRNIALDQQLTGRIEEVVIVPFLGAKVKLSNSNFIVNIVESGIREKENGRLLEKDSDYYNLNGQKVTKSGKAVYVINRNKVIVR